jgi:exodeoxyribonuclease VII large subunit
MSEERYSVGRLVGEINSLLREAFTDIWVEGEVSGFKPAASGHWYFSLKDPESEAVISCAMFRGDNSRVRKPPREGEKVLVHGSVDVYAPRGTFSLKIRRLELTGAGELARRLEELRARLAQEGLFDPSRKRELPAYPRAIGVATSPTGAALQDILRVLGQRWPGLPVYLAPCRVQGDGAAAEIAAAVRLLNQDGRADVLLIGRGGGSAEDLFCFNEEVVVRAIAESRIPTVSCVGHEVDVTLSDFAADWRAATPSHAVERATRLRGAMERRVRLARERLVRVRLQHPRQKIERGRQRADELDERLRAAIARGLKRRRERTDAATRHLDALSPLRVLDRGYALVQREGLAVTDAATLRPGDVVDARFAKGRATLVVKGKSGLF